MSKRYMLATTAVHLGTEADISRDEPDLCVVERETEHFLIGHWVTGFGFIEVWFPKATTRELTPEEVEKYQHEQAGIPGQPAFPKIPS